MEKLLTVDEAASLLRLSTSTVYKLTCRKRIPSLKINSALRFDPDELEAWIRKQAVKPIQ